MERKNEYKIDSFLDRTSSYFYSASVIIGIILILSGIIVLFRSHGLRKRKAIGIVLICFGITGIISGYLQGEF